jgi:glucose-1-phosphate adenylyltransferase
VIRGIKVLALVMAGGPGGRMEVLTEERAKPVMPYAGVYRLIDFPMSNCMHSGISDVWVIAQYQPQSLTDQLAHGRPWDLDRTYGGIRLVPPRQGGNESGWHQGNADAIYRNKTLIADFDPDVLVVLSSDHVYKLDYGKVIDHHLDREADVTIVTTKVPSEEASRFGLVEVDDDGRVTNFEYKPDSPQSDLAATEVFVYDPNKLIETIESLVSEDADDEEAALEDYGDELLPRLVEEGRAYEYRHEGYWRDVGTIEDYWASNMDLISPDPEFVLDDSAWPILTLGVDRPPARISGSASIVDALISPGCVIEGRVERSVLAPGVVVEEGATVRDSIVLHETVISSGATIECSIVDAEVSVGEGARIGEEYAPEEPGAKPSDSEIALVAKGARIEDDARVAAGDRVEPGATVEAL